MTLEPPTPITTIESALHWARSILKDTSETYQQDTRLLLSEVLQVTHEYLIRYPERAMTVSQAAAYQDLVTRLAKGEPMAYLLGRHHFYDIEVCVTPDVLIPRPETELLVERAIAWATGRHTFIVDVGAGSGIIALVLAKHLRNAHITGIDLSPAALDLARYNAEQLGLINRVRWLQGDLLKPMLALGETVDLIVANLPYVATDEMQQLAVARHEPHLALDGGADGLEVIRCLLADAPQVLKSQGMLLMEIGAGQGEAVRGIAEAAFPDRTIRVEPDLAGHDRIVSIS
jgi:release factor glutamine methyltransferase